jgi:hypothetical protein
MTKKEKTLLNFLVFGKPLITQILITSNSMELDHKLG